MQIEPYVSQCTKRKSKWIKDPNIKPDILNLTEEKVGTILKHSGRGDILQLKSFCKAKDTLIRTKYQPTDWEKIFTNPTSDRGPIFKIYKELKKLDSKKKKNQTQKT